MTSVKYGCVKEIEQKYDDGAFTAIYAEVAEADLEIDCWVNGFSAANVLVHYIRDALIKELRNE